MTIQEKTIKLAEVAGFTDIMLPMGFHQQMSDEKSKECGGRWRFEIPKYFEDLNAAHELEKIVELILDSEAWKLDHWINEVVCGDAGIDVDPNLAVSLIRKATAEQRCEAIGKTLNLW